MTKKGKFTSNTPQTPRFSTKVPKGLAEEVRNVLRQHYAERVDIAVDTGLLPKTLGRDIAEELDLSILWNRDLKTFDVRITFPDEPDAATVNDVVHGHLLTAMKNEDMEYETDYAQTLSSVYSVLNLQAFCRSVNSMTSPENKIRSFDRGHRI